MEILKKKNKKMPLSIEITTFLIEGNGGFAQLSNCQNVRSINKLSEYL